MNLWMLLEGVAYREAPEDTPIRRVTCDSRDVAQGDVFVCVRGQRADGHDHASGALEKGACAIVCERDLGLPNQVIVTDSRAAYTRMCANLCGNPQKDLKLVAVTGTSGKTTVTCLIRDILRAAGRQTGLIGTIQGEIGDMEIPARYTTPDPAQLFDLLARMKAAGIEFVVMEVSSHALDQRRVEGLPFLCSVFTNLSREHLDYHGTMENYYQAKRRLFDQSGQAVINIDTEYGRRLARETACPVATVSVSDNNADFTAHSIEDSSSGSRFVVVHNSCIKRVSIGMPGLYSVSNALCAYACAQLLGITEDEIVRGLQESRGVPGRLEVIETALPFTVIRDYAHAPEELQSVLSAVRGFAEGKVVTLFGCPGERDRGKRADMARAASQYSDFVIITSDNPRSEDPMQIINDARPGLEEGSTPFKIIVDRYDAIRYAIEHGEEGDILLLLGKGHEDYQVNRYGTIYFDERFIVQDIIRRLDEQDTI